MLKQANDAVLAAGENVGAAVTLREGTVSDIPMSDESFDTALSINVGCAIPNLKEHFEEMARVLRTGGHAIVTAPGSLGTTFTTYGDGRRKIWNLREALAGVNSDADMMRVAGEHNDILRATILSEERQYRLAVGVGQLASGQAIHRKIPGLVVPNHYHSQSDYESAMELAGLDIVEWDRPLLPIEDCNAEVGLGYEYTQRNAFDIYLLQKTA